MTGTYSMLEKPSKQAESPAEMPPINALNDPFDYAVIKIFWLVTSLATFSFFGLAQYFGWFF